MGDRAEEIVEVKVMVLSVELPYYSLPKTIFDTAGLAGVNLKLTQVSVVRVSTAPHLDTPLDRFGWHVLFKGIMASSIAFSQ